jgi:hypothetical protein
MRGCIVSFKGHTSLLHECRGCSQRSRQSLQPVGVLNLADCRNSWAPPAEGSYIRALVVPVCQASWNPKAWENRQRSKLDEDTASMAIVAAETDYGEVVGEGDGSGDTL